MTLYVGTSGWAYPQWKPTFYPAELPRSKFLQHYARVFNSCEINATFRRLQSESTFSAWKSQARPNFRFAIKAHRALTHARDIAPDDDRRAILEKFLKSLAPLGSALGPVLFQFPPYRGRDDGQLDALLSVLPPPGSYAFEFRHPSWAESNVAEQIRARGTVCLSETQGQAPQRLPAGVIAYVRLRADHYDDRARRTWRGLIEREAERRDVYVFCKHEGVAADDPFSGVGLARWLSDP